MAERNAIVGLVRGYKDLSQYFSLRRRNKLLKKNYMDKHGDATVIIFHEGNVTPEQQEFLSREAGMGITFYNVGNQFKTPACADRSNLGYKHMMRFYCMQMPKMLETWGYDKWWRLDDDSFILEPIDYSVFKWMNKKGAVYGYVHTKIPVAPQAKLTERTLLPVVADYMKANDIELRWGELNSRNYYNNFHVTSVHFWQKPVVRRFLEFLDKTQGIYVHRWGDHLIQALTLKLFADHGQVEKLPGIAYLHASHDFKIQT